MKGMNWPMVPHTAVIVWQLCVQYITPLFLAYGFKLWFQAKVRKFFGRRKVAAK